MEGLGRRKGGEGDAHLLPEGQLWGDGDAVGHGDDCLLGGV